MGCIGRAAYVAQNVVGVAQQALRVSLGYFEHEDIAVGSIWYIGKKAFYPPSVVIFMQTVECAIRDVLCEGVAIDIEIDACGATGRTPILAQQLFGKAAVVLQVAYSCQVAGILWAGSPPCTWRSIIPPLHNTVHSTS